MPSVLCDIRVGLHSGWQPLLTLLAILIVWVIAQNVIGAEFISQDVHLAENSEDLSGFFWSDLAVNIAWLVSAFLAYCWFLTSWLRSEFGLATPLQPVTFFCHVVVRQILASIVSYLAILVVSVPLLFILAFSVMFPILNTMEVMPTSIGGIFSQFLPIFIVMGVAGFFLYLTGIYLFLRCSVGLSVTARTGRSLKLGGSFRHCGNAAPQRSILRAGLSLTGLMFLLPIVAYAIGVSPFWLIYPSEMNALLSVNPMVHEQVAQMAQSNGIQIFQAGLTLFTLVALPFCAVLVMIRLSRRIPAEIEPTGS